MSLNRDAQLDIESSHLIPNLVVLGMFSCPSLAPLPRPASALCHHRIGPNLGTGLTLRSDSSPRSRASSEWSEEAEMQDWGWKGYIV